MLDQRLQVLVTKEQRELLEREARRRGASVGSLVREAVDAHLGPVTVGQRKRAVDEIRKMRGRFVSPEELNRIVDEERDWPAPSEAGASEA